MAFCVRSERNMDYIKKDKINIGPGQYFKSLDKNQIKKEYILRLKYQVKKVFLIK